MAAPDPTDRELYDRWAAGDLRAGSALFDRHFDAIHRFFRTKARAATDDLVQRTFLAAAEARDRFRHASSFRTFLFAIARHELLAHFRRARGAPIDDATATIADLDPTPSQVLAQHEERRVLLEALRTIPLELQVVLELHYWEELTMTEIAEILGVPDGTAKSRLRRAREALEARLAELTESPERLRTTLANLELWAADLGRQER